MALSLDEIRQIRQQAGLNNQKNPSISNQERIDRIMNLPSFEEDSEKRKAEMEKKQAIETLKRQKEEQIKRNPINAIGDFGEKIFGKPRDFLFSSFGKVSGTLTGGLGENINDLFPQKDSKQVMDKALYNQLKQKGYTDEQIKSEFYQKPERTFTDESGMPKISGIDAAFAALETYPGGGLVTKNLKKIPGAGYIAEGIEKRLLKTSSKLKGGAVKLYEKIFNPTSKESKALAEKTLDRLINEEGYIKSISELKDEAGKKSTIYGKEIDNWFLSLPKGSKTETKSILDNLFNLRGKYKVGGVDINEQGIKAVDEAINSLTRLSKNGEIETSNLRKLRQIWDEHYNISKGFDDIASYKKKVQRLGADSIRDVLAKNNPILAEINRNFTFWRNVESLAEYTSKKGGGKLTKFGTTALGSGLGAYTGGKEGGIEGILTGAVVGGSLANSLNRLISSPSFRSLTAKQLNNLSEFIMYGNKEGLQLFINRIISGTKNISD